MIDGKRRDPPAAGARPGRREQRQREAVGPAGNRDRQMARAFERAERCHQLGEFPSAYRPRRSRFRSHCDWPSNARATRKPLERAKLSAFRPIRVETCSI